MWRQLGYCVFVPLDFFEQGLILYSPGYLVTSLKLPKSSMSVSQVLAFRAGVSIPSPQWSNKQPHPLLLCACGRRHCTGLALVQTAASFAFEGHLPSTVESGC